MPSVVGRDRLPYTQAADLRLSEQVDTAEEEEEEEDEEDEEEEDGALFPSILMPPALPAATGDSLLPRGADCDAPLSLFAAVPLPCSPAPGVMDCRTI